MTLFLLPSCNISSRSQMTAERVVRQWDSRVQAGLSDSFSLILCSKTFPGVTKLRWISLDFHSKLWQEGLCKPGKQISIPTVPIHFIITTVFLILNVIPLFKTLKNCFFFYWLSVWKEALETKSKVVFQAQICVFSSSSTQSFSIFSASFHCKTWSSSFPSTIPQNISALNFFCHVLQK